jgi:hypothetical protein
MRAEVVKTIIQAAWVRNNATVILISPSMSG